MFIPSELLAIARQNIERYEWAAEVRRHVVAAAAPWLAMSDDETWSLMFPATMTRAWHVWSNGHCPACRVDVPMYQWKVEALRFRWKVRCPNCEELFPKNDFEKFYKSGLDEKALFDPAKADRSLLFNTEHPDPHDPLHRFGVDDGEGYVEGEARWRFIGAYLIYGQWKQLIVGGISTLATAYVLTGESIFARKAAILLDRVADLYPTFDHKTQSWAYETVRTEGFVSTWHDACEETREMTLGYDAIRPALDADKTLADFLSEKSRRHELAPKTNAADIRRNIETGILREAIQQHHKIRSNYPSTDVALATMHAVLDWPGNRGKVRTLTDEIIEKATAVDGVTGEKGLTSYSSYVIHILAVFLAQLERLEPGTLKELIARHPSLARTYRFHIDTWCMQEYYPQVGDGGNFAAKTPRYVGAPFAKLSSGSDLRGMAAVRPSMFSFFWNLYEATGDAGYVQVLHHANQGVTDGLPHDIFCADPEGFQQHVEKLIARHGREIIQPSVNFENWRLAILRSGRGASARAAWLDYDSGERHAHNDGMNLGLFAKGLDLMPEFGYPPVQFGGWETPRCLWYRMTAAHNTVTVDCKSQPGPWNVATRGRTTLWAEGKTVRAVRASDPTLTGIPPFPQDYDPARDGPCQYERTTVMLDISEDDSYLVDIFRVVGGRDHAKFQHSCFATLTTQGLTLRPAQDYGHDTQMRNFQEDANPPAGWVADWKIEDHYKYLPEGTDVHLRHTDLTSGASAATCEGWIVSGGFDSMDQAWVPRLLVRRQAEHAPLASTFVAVIEPYVGRSNIKSIRRLPLVTADGRRYGDAHVAVEVELADGRRDLILSADAENPQKLSPVLENERILMQPDWGVKLEGDFCVIRRDAAGKVRMIGVCQGSVGVGGKSVKIPAGVKYAEQTF